jgi:uncharacterized NAD(P)/FAD-binding protein YdhS
MHWLRAQLRRHQQLGGDRRALLDGVRPHTQRLWGKLSQQARSSFLRHASSYWDVHRHRMAPVAAKALASAQASGQLKLIRGELEALQFCRAHRPELVGQSAALEARVRVRGAPPCLLEFDFAIECRGLRAPTERAHTPLFTSLLSQALASEDVFGMGLRCSEDGVLLKADGSRFEGVYAVGPVTRGRFFEITAIPEIRVQVAGLLERWRLP